MSDEYQGEIEPMPPTDKADADLIRFALRGNREAYGQLYDRHARLIRAVCHDTTRDLHDAEDLCQEVFLRAYTRLHELRELGRFAAWLVGIARMVCREWRRKSARDRTRQTEFMTDRIAEQPAPCDQDVEDDRILAAIARLPERERMALHLVYVREYPFEVARETLRLSRSGFYRVLDRARRRLEQVLLRKGALIL